MTSLDCCCFGPTYLLCVWPRWRSPQQCRPQTAPGCHHSASCIMQNVTCKCAQSVSERGPALHHRLHMHYWQHHWHMEPAWVANAWKSSLMAPGRVPVPPLSLGMCRATQPMPYHPTLMRFTTCASRVAAATRAAGGVSIICLPAATTYSSNPPTSPAHRSAPPAASACSPCRCCSTCLRTSRQRRRLSRAPDCHLRGEQRGGRQQMQTGEVIRPEVSVHKASANSSQCILSDGCQVPRGGSGLNCCEHTTDGKENQLHQG